MHTPSHFVTAPVDTGKGFTKPLRSLRASRTFHPTPSRFATAPVGHWGAFSPNPLSLLRSEFYIIRW